MDTKAKIIEEDGEYRYFDKNGQELHAGDTIVHENGREELLYLSEEGRLGTDATNPAWIKNGRAEPCEYGLYPLNLSDLEDAVRKEK